MGWRTLSITVLVLGLVFQPPFGVPAGAGESHPEVPAFSVAHLDRSVAPERDFYRFAAGAWLSRNPVPAGRSRWAALDQLQERNRSLVRGVLVEAAEAARDGQPSVQKLVGDFYAAAVDDASRDRSESRALAGELKAIDDARKFTTCARLLASLHLRDINALFTPVIQPDGRPPRINSLHIFQGGLSLPGREQYRPLAVQDPQATLHPHMVRMFQLVGATEARALEQADAALECERRLAEISRSSEGQVDPNDSGARFTVEQLAAFAPGFPWKDYLHACGLGRLEQIVVGQPEFVRGLGILVESIGLEEWKAYLKWHLIRAAAPYLSWVFEEESRRFQAGKTAGMIPPEERWTLAAQTINHRMGEALGSLYVRRHFPAGTRLRARQMAERVQLVLADRVRTLPWMTDETRARALAKLGALRVKIGYPDRFRDYSAVEIRRDDYLGNVWRAARFEVRRQFNRIGQPWDPSEWVLPPQSLNGGYLPDRNELIYPAGILQPPFFDAGMDDAVNYGAAGILFARELIGALGEPGRRFGPDGTPGDWWAPEDSRAYAALARKVAAQYDGYEALPGIRVDGEASLDASIADLGGASIAYEALERLLAEEPSRNKTIDGFSPEQRFFLSLAQVHRANWREEELRELARRGPVAPPEWRAKGPLRNLPQFHGAFGVKAGDPMWLSPEDRIRIW